MTYSSVQETNLLWLQQRQACVSGEIHLWRGLPTEREKRDVALRTIAAQYTGKPWDQMRLRRLPGGKPVFEGGVPHFSLTHTNDKTLAVFASCTVGIDIEAINRNISADAIACRYFHQSEYKVLAACSKAYRRLMFFRIWVRKEAAVKMMGEGLALGLRKVVVDLTKNGWPVSRDGELLFVREFAPWPGAVGAIVTRQPISETTFREF